MFTRILIISAFLFLCACQSVERQSVKSSQESAMSEVKPPIAKQQPHRFEIHGDVRIDNYHWLRDDTRERVEVIDYLNAENQYVDHVMDAVGDLPDRLYEEMVARIVKDDQSVPYRLDDYWYYRRFSADQEYPVYARRKGSLEAEEEILMDMNQRAEGSSFFQSNAQTVSPNHKMFGFSEDLVGRRKYTLRFKDLTNGTILPDAIENTTGSMAWAKDNKTVFYTRKHPVTLLPYQVYRHKLGTPVEEDVLVYEEKDNTFYVSCYSSRSKEYIVIQIGSTTQSEVRLLPTDEPDGEFKVFLPREADHEYSIEDYGDTFLINTNWQAKNFRIMKANLATSQDKSSWQEVVPHDEETLIYGMEAFRDWLVIDQRSDGIKHIKAMNWTSGKEKIISADESAYTMWTDFNPQQDTNIMRYTYNSMTQPGQVFDIDLNSGEKTLLKEQQIKGGFDQSQYRSERINIDARDGAKVPVSLVYRAGLGDLNERPILVYGYGSYGSSVDPRFSISRISLLDRGFIFAIAHIRGSQARGRGWYEDGKLFNKKNTFTDFIDATEGLLTQGYGDKDRVYGMGGSAGGLLMGAVANMRGDLYHGMLAAVPFVDVITTMLDEDIPLTTGEFDEWGNPKEKDAYEYMLSYSPYDQVKAQDYPNMMVTTGLHDSQVQYWEPAKWVAKLRELKTDDNILVMRTNMDAGHGGASGRFQAYKEVAEEYAFLLLLSNPK